MRDELKGKKLGKYRIIDLIGRGSMAEVYKAYDDLIGRFVAIKILHNFWLSEEAFLARFEREVKTISDLDHPNIISLFDFDILDKNSVYLVMKYIDGGTLKQKLLEANRNSKIIPITESIDIVIQIANALTYAHSRNIIHRDIKPSNILLTSTGDAILTDFGIVKNMIESQFETATGALIGTPAYMSPEQAKDEYEDERTDIYSLGIVLYEMTTGQTPFQASSAIALAIKHLTELPTIPMDINRDIHPRVQEIILKALEKNPDDRFRSTLEMVEALSSLDSMNKQFLDDKRPQTDKFSTMQFDRVIFRDLMSQHFSLSDLNEILFDLSIELEDMSGKTKKDKIIEIIKYCERLGSIQLLFQKCNRLRPNVLWENVFIKPKNNP